MISVDPGAQLRQEVRIVLDLPLGPSRGAHARQALLRDGAVGDIHVGVLPDARRVDRPGARGALPRARRLTMPARPACRRLDIAPVIGRMPPPPMPIAAPPRDDGRAALPPRDSGRSMNTEKSWSKKVLTLAVQRPAPRRLMTQDGARCSGSAQPQFKLRAAVGDKSIAAILISECSIRRSRCSQRLGR